MTNYLPIKFPAITIIDDEVLFDALRLLSPATFKLFVYLLHRAQNYEDAGRGHERKFATEIADILKLETTEITESFRLLREMGWIQAFSASYCKIYAQLGQDWVLSYRWWLELESPEIGDAAIYREEIEQNIPNEDGLTEQYVVIGCKLLTQEIRKEKSSQCSRSHWQKIRLEVIERDHHKCRYCSETHNLHVHHLTYENEGAEKHEDLITLCASCHGKQGGRM